MSIRITRYNPQDSEWSQAPLSMFATMQRHQQEFLSWMAAPAPLNESEEDKAQWMEYVR